MELLQLKYFRTAAKYENFSLAAKKHMVPQSAISKTIAKLENELGCELFTRKGKKVYLNENGKLFLVHIGNALEEIDTAVKAIGKKKINQIRLYIQAGIRYVPDLISAYQNEHNVTRIISYQGADNMLMGEEFDLTIMQLPLYSDRLEYITLMRDNIELAVSVEHKLAKKKSIRAEQLKEETFIAFCKTNQLRALTDQYCEEHGFLPNVIYEANEAALFRSMIETNAGISFVPVHSWKRIKSDTVVLIPLKKPLKRELVLAWHKDHLLSSEVIKFIDFAEKWFQFL